MALINPEITVVGDETVDDWEGCLSIPDIRGRVTRARDDQGQGLRRQRAPRSRSRPRFHGAGHPARDRSSRRRAVLRSDGVVRDADLPRRVRQATGSRHGTSEEGQRTIERVRATVTSGLPRFRSSSRSLSAAPAPPPSDRRTVIAAAIARWPARSAMSAVHLLADAAVGGVPLRRGAQLDHVHRLARVHLHVEADAVGHRHRVGRGGLEAGGAERFVELRRARPSPASSRRATPASRERVGLGVAVARATAAATRASAADGAADRGTRRSR